MLEHIANRLRVADTNFHGGRNEAVAAIRPLGLADFSTVLWAMPLAGFPKLSAVLPAMASEDVQRHWTGDAGERLLTQSLSYMRSVAANVMTITGAPLDNKKILDFGCGYGRFSRLSLYYSDEVWGCDPWDESIRICHEAGLREQHRVSDYLPDSLPVPEDFDVVLAFSVFTHLSQTATLKALAAMRRHVKFGGVACITIRPIEYWSSNYGDKPSIRDGRVAEHRGTGFAFQPHQREEIGGEVTYGDTSLSIDWLERSVSRWRIAGLDRSVDDPMQRYVFLRAI